ncbi:MAG: hypothetical protein ABSG36_05620 [Acidimicrobiales bacterium]|jgi:hypothetical protein
MTNARLDLAKAAGAFTALAKEASYIAIGAGVLGLQKAQVRRRELAGGREEMTKRARDLDANVAQVIKLIDNGLEPVFQRLPGAVQAAVQQAREARDELRTRFFGLPA